MYSRILPVPEESFFLFGPRGTGKSTWVRQHLPGAAYIDLLEARMATSLLADPQRLGDFVPPGHRGWVIIDEVQKVPALLDEVHRLMGRESWRFCLTGSSARKLRRQGINLLAGRALTCTMHALTATELQADFSLERALRFGTLPAAVRQAVPQRFLRGYVQTYLREEVQQEGLTRNLAAFARFLEAASFNQAMPLNVSSVARDCAVERKVVEEYFSILQDLLIAHRIPVFSRRAKRTPLKQSKFFFFDAGVFRALRPSGPLDRPESIDGQALETLLFTHVMALNAYLELNYQLSYWRTAKHVEVDMVLYGERGLVAIEMQRAHRVRDEDLRGLRAFAADYPEAHLWMIYGGAKPMRAEPGIALLPVDTFFAHLPDLLAQPERLRA